MSDRPAPRVSFLIAGVQKAGTTALHSFLSEHPELSLSKRKELHFFDDEDADWSAPSFARYEAHFDGAAHRLCGESTPVYLFHPPCIARIRAYNPAMRLIVLLRHPVERAFSNWRMEVSRGLETLSFSDAIRSGRDRMRPDDLHARPDNTAWRTYSYVERGFYAPQLVRLLQAFPRQQILFLRHEDLSAHRIEVFARIWDFLGCTAPGDLPRQRFIRPLAYPEGAPPVLSRQDDLYLRALYHDDIVETERLSGLDLARWIDSDGLGKINSRDCGSNRTVQG